MVTASLVTLNSDACSLEAGVIMYIRQLVQVILHVYVCVFVCVEKSLFDPDFNMVSAVGQMCCQYNRCFRFIAVRCLR